ncbi:PLP-dependent aspartate aminotransferase family protein [Anaerolineales bacterium HSG24]|nr:PLP-dependent aspartate aminotransferase family protein [Anaerolineales bacterium HSG24]
MKQYNIQTQAVHAGESPDPTTGASSPNLVMSSTYVTEADAVFSANDLTPDIPYIYTRWANPTTKQLEKKLAVLENGEAALAFATGMAAITNLFLYLLKPGDHLVMSDVAYAGNVEFVHETLPNFGVEVSFVNMSNLDSVAEAIRANTKLVYVESPANPIMRLTDIKAVTKLAHAVGAEVAVDSTFATPIATRPLDLGADYAIHSLTKYIGGHGDALGGVVIGRAEQINGLRQTVSIHMGGTISPFNSWLIMRGAVTLPLRMRAHEIGALNVAQFLEEHPKVTRVMYPGLPSHPQHELAQHQMANFSGMLTFQVEDGPAMAQQLSKQLKVFHYAVSLGHHRSLIFYLSTENMQRSTFRLSPAGLARYRQFAGDGIFRTSIGIEDPHDLCDDLAQALG